MFGWARRTILRIRSQRLHFFQTVLNYQTTYVTQSPPRRLRSGAPRPMRGLRSIVACDVWASVALYSLSSSGALASRAPRRLAQLCRCMAAWSRAQQ